MSLPSSSGRRSTAVWPALSFGRLRTAHTTLVLFGFGVSALIGTAFYSVQRTSHVRLFAPEARLGRVLCLAGHHRARRGLDPRRLECGQGVCGTRMAVRPRDHRGVGRLRGRILRHDREAQGRSDLHLQLVLRRADHRRGDAAHRQQPGAAGDTREILFVVRGRSGCRRTVVVRPQCRRLPADRRLSRDALLLPSETGGAADLELPAFDPRVLGLRLHLHLGGAPSPALSRDSGMAAVARHGHEPDSARAVLGDAGQRHHDGQRRGQEAEDRSGAEVHRAGARLLRARDVRGADARDQERQCIQPLYRVDHRARALGSARLERVDHVWHVLFHGAAHGRDAALQRAAREHPFLAGPCRHDAVRARNVGRRRVAGRAVAVAR